MLGTKIIFLNFFFLYIKVIDSQEFNQDRAKYLGSSLFRPSIFHLVTFSNEECLDSGNQTGTCYTAAECRAYGGSGTSSCAKGFGVCCIISKSCHNKTSQKVVYFKNPSYPALDTSHNYCDLTIEVKDRDVCQIKFDLLDFQLDQPEKGDCNGNNLKVTATGLSTNSIPLLCGFNRNQHFYIDLPDISERSAYLLFQTQSNNGYRWYIRATQINCLSSASRKSRARNLHNVNGNFQISLPAPRGCLQYFTEKSGLIESFNFGHYFNQLNYAICIERHSDTCKVVYSANKDEWSIASTSKISPFSQSGDTVCESDYLMIPGASENGDGKTHDRFCGPILNAVSGSFDTSKIVSKSSGPIVLRFYTDNIHNEESKLGFKLKYEQENTDCTINYSVKKENLLR